MRGRSRGRMRGEFHDGVRVVRLRASFVDQGVLDAFLTAEVHLGPTNIFDEAVMFVNLTRPIRIFASMVDESILDVEVTRENELSAHFIDEAEMDVALTVEADDGAELVAAGFATGTMRVMTSEDAITWNNHDTGFGWQPIRVIHAPGLTDARWLAISESGNGALQAVMTSPDGFDWTQQDIPTESNVWYDVAYSHQQGLFVAVAHAAPAASTIMTSPDGVNWTNRTHPTSNPDVTGVAYSPTLDLWVIIGQATPHASSPDGINWTERTNPVVDDLLSVVWAGGSIQKFVAVGNDSLPQYSSNGIAWSTSTIPQPTAVWRDLSWSPRLDRLAAVGWNGSAGVAATSDDGINWTERVLSSPESTKEWSGVTWSDALQLFVAVSRAGGTNNVMTSPDGVTWTLQTVAGAGGLISVASASEDGPVFVFDFTDQSTMDVALTVEAEPEGGSETGDASGTFETPDYNVLMMELWGAGASGGQVSGNNRTAGVNGATTSIASKSLSALGGLAPTTNSVTGGVGQTPTGGDDNITGVNGGNGNQSGLTSGKGGDAPNGGLGGAAVTSGTQSSIAGLPGAIPGGGGSGNAAHNKMATGAESAAGGASGSYLRKIYVFGVTSGAPTVGEDVAYIVAAGNDGPGTAGDGAQGRAKFTWTVTAEFAKLVGVGASGGVVQSMYSLDGVTWINNPVTHLVGQTVSFQHLCSAPGELSARFVAVSATGNSSSRAVLRSPDGINWVGVDIPNEGVPWEEVCYSAELGLFCAVASGSGTNNRIMTSSDGLSWTSRSHTTSINFQAVCYSDDLNLFVAMGAGTVCCTSPDGTTWTDRTCLAQSTTAICYAGGTIDKFVSCAAGAAFQTSPDGTTWTSRTVPSKTWRDVCYSPDLDLLVAVAENQDVSCVITSPDGINWTTRTLAAPEAAGGWRGVRWSSELQKFFAVSERAGNKVMESADGITWAFVASTNGGAMQAVAII